MAFGGLLVWLLFVLMRCFQSFVKFQRNEMDAEWLDGAFLDDLSYSEMHVHGECLLVLLYYIAFCVELV